jgi:3-(3-hydroxy-phenyl)propionate hydroxylase
VTERVLHDACIAAGVDFVWNIEVTKAVSSDSRVRIGSAGSPIASARYVIGADGSRSAVRESAGLRLEGPRTSNAFVIVDTEEDPADPLPLERVFHYEHPNVGYRNVLFVPFAGHWRVDLQCAADDDPEDVQRRRRRAPVAAAGDAREVRRSRDLGVHVCVPAGDCHIVRGSHAPHPARR